MSGETVRKLTERNQIECNADCMTTKHFQHMSFIKWDEGMDECMVA